MTEAYHQKKCAQTWESKNNSYFCSINTILFENFFESAYKLWLQVLPGFGAQY